MSDRVTLRVAVAAGEGLVARRHDLVAVFPALAPTDDAAALVALVERAAVAADPLATLAEGGDTGLRPPVGAVAGADRGAVEVLVAGDVDVRIVGMASELNLNARAAGGPVRRTVDADAVEITLGGPGRTAERPWLDLESGVVAGGGARIALSTSAPGAVAAPAVSTPGAELPDAGGAGDALPPPPGEFADFEAISLLDAAPEAEPEPLPLDDEADPAAEVVEGVEVVGIRCRRGHFNHPHSANCAWCGLSMVQDSHVPVTGPRPPLGVLVVNDAATFTLDHDYVLGRSPDRDPSVGNEAARALPLQDPDRSVSRVHAAVWLREWDVVLGDRGSANGTWVLNPPAGSWAHLRDGAEVVLTPGAQIQIGPHRLAYHSHHVR